MGLFAYRRIAEGYARHRPRFHSLVVHKIRQRVNLDGKFATALDVGCGTGLSTSALRDLAEHIVGVDSSAEMIAIAKAQKEPGITYYLGTAEELAFAESSFDLITVSGAINWIERDKFLPEARRVLKEKGWLIIYDNCITEHMRESSAYELWYKEQYLLRYPKPPRKKAPHIREESGTYGFRFDQAEEYTNDIVWSLEKNIDFLLTQSNIIAAVDTGKESVEDVRTWMYETLAPIIPDKKGTFEFRGYIWYLQRC